jgi:hypothetical protein
MIRIDEIYCNTFLPLVQDRPNHGLHWFDPFGSVRFEDLKNLPAVNAGDQTQRYLFWDQEPVHEDLFAEFADQYVKIYRGQTRLITSEHQSEFVERVCNTYGFSSHYYFFHGWASLDWFRGYNRSFLMVPPEQRQIRKTFLAPNRIVAGKRDHRVLFLYNVFKQGLDHNHVSAPRICPAEQIDITSIAQKYTNVYQDISNVFESADLPRTFAGEDTQNMSSYCLDLFDQAAESLLYVITETVADGRRHHLTEKTFKPICLQMPFVMVAPAGSLSYLRRYGFKTFSHLWDESYDQETDTVKRIEAVTRLLSELDQLPAKEKQQLYQAARSTVVHNYNHFYNGGFEQCLWLELKQMLEDLDV